MFTFLEYDGVPWNNNHAEHAIKRFAKYRRVFDGLFTEDSLNEYLILASVLINHPRESKSKQCRYRWSVSSDPSSDLIFASRIGSVGAELLRAGQVW